MEQKVCQYNIYHFSILLYIFAFRKIFFKRDISHNIKAVLVGHIIPSGGKDINNLDAIFQY